MARIGNTRQAFIETLMEIARQDPRTVLVCADSILVIRARPFAQEFPDRFIDVGIAEQNAVALAAGMASCGLVPYVATYAGFITMRACEQVRTFVAYPGLNVRFIGANGGIAAGEREGVTHQFFEDLGIMRTIPGITVVAPADQQQVKEATTAIHKVQGPAYMRIGSGRDPIVECEYRPFELGKIRILADFGRDVAIFANGPILNRAICAAERLRQEGIKAVVADVHTLRPIDRDGILELIRQTRSAVTVEDHNIIGGLGSAIAELACQDCPVPVMRLGLPDTYPRSGEPEALWDHYDMGVDDIERAARHAIALRNTNDDR
ncbi:MAG: transketolase C-terminal domain-containing protein [Sedimentisphaerales bacterium]|jgi:transketolase|nr:transketolase C-terminal domain-containing protein [Sedimentisphaerales bacterium]